MLSPIPGYTELSIKKKFYKLAFFGPVASYSSGVFLNDLLDIGEIKPALAAHGVIIGCRIVKKHANFVDHFHIGSSKNDPRLNHFLINNLDIFERHIQEFYDTTKFLREQYEKRPLYFPKGTETSGMQFFENQASQHHLTIRELEIINCIRLGLSNKMIARKLNISPRTVDKHIENIFIEAQVHSRSALLFKLK